MSLPSKMTLPAESGVNRRIILPSVDFPLPLSPMSETTSPRSMLEADRRRTSFSPPPKVPVL